MSVTLARLHLEDAQDAISRHCQREEHLHSGALVVAAMWATWRAYGVLLALALEYEREARA